ncbi:hypothetical protein D3C78_1313150 [compost metagenome]
MSTAFLKAMVVAPLGAVTEYGYSVPCSISALVWSAVIRRGLETILPLPSASIADSSSVRKRLAAELKIDRAKVPALLTPDSAAGRFTNVPDVSTVPPAPAVAVALP